MIEADFYMLITKKLAKCQRHLHNLTWQHYSVTGTEVM